MSGEGSGDERDVIDDMFQKHSKLDWSAEGAEDDYYHPPEDEPPRPAVRPPISPSNRTWNYGQRNQYQRMDYNRNRGGNTRGQGYGRGRMDNRMFQNVDTPERIAAREARQRAFDQQLIGSAAPPPSPVRREPQKSLPPVKQYISPKVLERRQPRSLTARREPELSPEESKKEEEEKLRKVLEERRLREAAEEEERKKRLAEKLRQLEMKDAPAEK